MEFIDSHAHINADQFKDNWKDIVDQAQQAGVSTIINNASNLIDTEWGIDQAEQSKHVYTTAGIHPEVFLESDQSVTDDDLYNLRRLIVSSKKVVAIGEIGLDYTLDEESAPPKKQWDLIEPQLQLAADLQLPVTLHVRDKPGGTRCFDDLISILKQFTTSNQKDESRKPKVNNTPIYPTSNLQPPTSGPSPTHPTSSAGWRTPTSGPTGVFHCWVGTPSQAEVALDLGFYLSFSGILTYKSAGHIVDVAAQAPMDKILIETDAPFLTPEPTRSKIKPSVNEPKYVIMTAEKLAGIRTVSIDSIAKSTSENTRQLFNLPTRD